MKIAVIIDAAGNEYSGITSLVIPILSTNDRTIEDIVQRVQQDSEITLIHIKQSF